jgi:hypothetical protein
MTDEEKSAKNNVIASLIGFLIFIIILFGLASGGGKVARHDPDNPPDYDEPVCYGRVC